MSKFDISIGLFGCVSVGKSTFINAATGQRLAHTEIKRTTVIPQVYVDAETGLCDPKTVKKINKLSDESADLLVRNQQFDLEACKAIYHRLTGMGSMFDLAEPQHLRINMYDLPGLNDPVSRSTYLEWLAHNIERFDILVFITDIHRGLNNSDDVEILHMLLQAVKNYQSRMVCLMNKCDDMVYVDSLGDLVFATTEQENIYLEANAALRELASQYEIDLSPETVTLFHPVSLENYHIYHTVASQGLIALPQNQIDRLCRMTVGSHRWNTIDIEQQEEVCASIAHSIHETIDMRIRDTGYTQVKRAIHRIITNNQNTFVANRVERLLEELGDLDINKIDQHIPALIETYEKLAIAYDTDLYEDDNPFWSSVLEATDRMLAEVRRLRVRLTRFNGSIHAGQFDQMHTALQVHCMNLETLVSTCSSWSGYPTDCMWERQQILVSRLLDLYEQLCDNRAPDYVLTCPRHIQQCLQAIKLFAPARLHEYALRFVPVLGKRFHNKQAWIDGVNDTELRVCYNYIADHSDAYDPNADLKLIAGFSDILMGKQEYLRGTEIYLPYLIQIKKLVASLRSRCKSNYSPLDILYEVTDKNIGFCLTAPGLANLYKPEIDVHKVSDLLYASSLHGSLVNINLEYEMLTALVERLIAHGDRF
ncbi:Hypothetical protein MVR_LOCUS327 [uncultured virus]|nr:Hypothetical protein MVR_LOCUS327 [uncultured virus]